MKTNKKTVFFGPWVGEFGWEFDHWYAWVNKVSQDEFKDYRKIASSYPSRKPFYPSVDEFWEHPQEYEGKFQSARNYITDNWIDDRPRPNSIKVLGKKLITPSYQENTLPKNQSSWANKLLDDYKKVLPADTVYFTPWQHNKYERQNLEFGILDTGSKSTIRVILDLLLFRLIKLLPGRLLQKWKWFSDLEFNINNDGFKTLRIPFDCQDFVKLMPSYKAKEKLLVEYNLQDSDSLICIFPRNREHRRPDKNWNETNYISLIEEIKKIYPDNKIALLGEPGGSYFSENNTPEGCIDLINIKNDDRMDLHLAALSKSACALGSLSGAMLFSLASGTTSIIWGNASQEKRTRASNMLESHLVFIGEDQPDPRTILNSVRNLLSK